MKKLVKLWVLLVAVSILVISCATGVAFKKTALIPGGKALIYFYRSKNLRYWTSVPAVKHNGIKIIDGLPAGGYYPYFTDPGNNEFEAGSKIFLDVKAGETYYIRMDFDEGLLLITSKLTIVYGPQGESEIQVCKLIQNKQ